MVNSCGSVESWSGQSRDCGTAGNTDIIVSCNSPQQHLCFISTTSSRKDKMATQVESIPPQLRTKELSFPLPKALHTTAHVHLTTLETCAMVFITTTTPGETTGPSKPMGSFVYAMPDVSLVYHTFVCDELKTECLAYQPKIRPKHYALHLIQHRVYHSTRQDPGSTDGTASLCGV